jgi:hypothetical protein
MMKDECRDLVDLYSLDLLAGAELSAFEIHIERCGSCQAILAANRKALASLGTGVGDGFREGAQLADRPGFPRMGGSLAWSTHARIRR